MKMCEIKTIESLSVSVFIDNIFVHTSNVWKAFVLVLQLTILKCKN